METLETLADLLATTRDIRAIVRTMKALSAVSIRQYEHAETALGGYARTVEYGLIALLRDRRAQGLPPPETAAGQRTPSQHVEALIVIGSDRGLCGRYNENVSRFALGRIGDETSVLAVFGARAAARLEAQGHPPTRQFALPGSVGGISSAVHTLIMAIDRWTREDRINRVRLVHNARKGRATAEPTELPLLPIPDATLAALAHAPWPGPGLPFFRMPPAQLLSWLVQQRLFVMIYKALAEALASEHATRLAAMQRAERNIEDRHDALTSTYRRKRQETITRELLDIAAGFAAVSDSDDEDHEPRINPR